MSAQAKHRRPPHEPRHAAPTTVQQAAGVARAAAPAVAIAGVLVAAQPATAAVSSPAAVTVSTGQVQALSAGQVTEDWRPYLSPVPPETISTDALVVQHEPAWRYTIQVGDTLSSIALRFYRDAGDWTLIWQANKTAVPNPNEILPGRILTIPAAAGAVPAAAPATVTASDTLSGTLSCTGLEQLWEAAGGADGEAFMAAEIAMAESGGLQDALSPTDDFGYWQINGSHGPAEATFNAYGNAHAAVTISDDGTNWTPWTTFLTGAYQGRC